MREHTECVKGTDDAALGAKVVLVHAMFFESVHGCGLLALQASLVYLGAVDGDVCAVRQWEAGGGNGGGGLLDANAGAIGYKEIGSMPYVRQSRDGCRGCTRSVWKVVMKFDKPDTGC